MPLGTWKILNNGTFETLDLGKDEHSDLVQNPELDELTLRDEGLAGTADQDSAPLPIYGEWSLYVGVVNAATYSAGNLVPVIQDPTVPDRRVQLAQGSGAPVGTAVIHATASTARGIVLHGPLPRGLRLRAYGLAGDGTGHLLVIARKWPAIG